MTNWGSAYGGSGSTGSDWGSFYGGSSGGGVPVGHSSGGGGGGGILGGIEGAIKNLGSDAYHTVIDAPAGFATIAHQVAYDNSHYNIFSNPSTWLAKIEKSWHDPHSLAGGSERPFVQNERHIYGSALHGNFHPIYEHPLTPILDALTIASLGGAGALRLGATGALGEKAADLANSDRALRVENLTEKLNQSRTLQGRYRQRAYDAFSMAHQDAPIVGSASRLNRIGVARAYRQSLRDMIPVGQFRRLISPLSKDERTAVHIATEGVPLDERLSFYKNLPQTRTISRYIRSIDKPGVREALANPSENLVKAVHGARDIEELASQRLIGTGQLTQEIREARAVLPQRIMAGAEWSPAATERIPGFDPYEIDRPAMTREAQQAARRVPGLERRVTTLQERVRSYNQRMKSAGENASPRLTSQSARALAAYDKAVKDLADARQARDFTGEGVRNIPPPTPAETIQTAAEFHGPESDQFLGQPNRVNPVFGSPFRLPHADAEGRSGLYTAPKGAPTGKVKDLGILKKNTGARLAGARVATDPETFVRDLLQTQRHEQLLQMQHRVLDKVAKPLSKEQVEGDQILYGGKQANEHYYRPSYNRKSTVPIPRHIRDEEALARDFETEPQRELGVQHAAGHTVFTEKNAPADLADALQHGDIDKLNRLGVKRIPSAFGKRFTDNFAGTSAKTRFFVDRPLDVWRMLTLNLRPAWMVNNLVGNNVMYFLRHPGGAAEYLKTLLQTERGEDKVARLWKWTVKHPTIRRKYERIFNEVAPEIHSSGLYATQTRVTRPGAYQQILDRSSAVQAAKKIALPVKAITYPIRALGHGITFFERHIAEDAPREAAMLREVKPFIDKMKKAGMSTEEALKSLDPRDVELAVDRTNDALGDFNSLSPFERRVVRRFIPFWSWYRVIVTVSGKFAARYPGRLLLIHAIAQQAAAEDKKLPSWLQGEIQLGPVKGGVQPVLTTAGINPYQTLAQVATENPASMLNPFIGAGLTGFTNVDPFTGNTYQGFGQNTGFNPANVGERAAGSFLSGLAPTRLGMQLTGNAHNSKIYQPKTYGHAGPIPINDALLQYLGLPIRHVRVKQAEEDAKKGY